jgi:hypothetical protein
MPDFSADNSNGLSLINSNKLSKQTTEDNFTTELNFKTEDGGIIFSYKDENNYYFLEYNSKIKKVTLNKKNDGESSQISQFDLFNCQNKDAIQTVRIESGFKKTYIYFNNMRKFILEENCGLGKIGYLKNTEGFYTAFTNDVFGTSDFEALKNLPSAFPAIDYLKTENRGFYISDAKISNNGVRQGEKENTKFVESEQAYSLILNKKEDYIKYAVNASENSSYSLTARLNKSSAGAKIEVIIDNNIYLVTIPDINTNEGNEYTNVILGNFDLTNGNHTVKIRLFSGILDVLTWQFLSGEEIKNFNDTLTENSDNFYVKTGNFNYGNGLISLESGVNILLSKSGINQNYTISCDMGYLNDSINGSGGIVFRMKNYSYFPLQPAQSFQGYYLEIKKSLLSLNKYNYGEKRLSFKACVDSNRQGIFTVGNINNVKISVENNLIIVYLNDQIFFEVYDDNAYLNGSFGIYTNNSNMIFKNFSYSEEL